MVGKSIDTERHASAGSDFVADELSLGIRCCEVALTSASARTWDSKIRNARKAHDTAQRYVHRFRLSEHEAQRINQRIVHLKTLLEELKSSVSAIECTAIQGDAGHLC
jgi:hypothetical protein